MGYPAGNWGGYMEVSYEAGNWVGYMQLGEASRPAIQQVIREVAWGRVRSVGGLSCR